MVPVEISLAIHDAVAEATRRAGFNLVSEAVPVGPGRFQVMLDDALYAALVAIDPDPERALRICLNIRSTDA